MIPPGKCECPIRHTLSGNDASSPPASATESTILPGVSDWAAEWMFGDESSAISTAQPWMGGAGMSPRTPEERRLSRIKRGGPEVARGARILEGDEAPAAEVSTDASAEESGSGA